MHSPILKYDVVLSIIVTFLYKRLNDIRHSAYIIFIRDKSTRGHLSCRQLSSQNMSTENMTVIKIQQKDFFNKTRENYAHTAHSRNTKLELNNLLSSSSNRTHCEAGKNQKYIHSAQSRANIQNNICTSLLFQMVDPEHQVTPLCYDKFVQFTDLLLAFFSQRRNASSRHTRETRPRSVEPVRTFEILSNYFESLDSTLIDPTSFCLKFES